MAISKKRRKKTEMTPQAMGLFIAAGVLVLLSLFLVWKSISRYRLKSNFRHALFSCASNNPGKAGPSLKAAINADPYNVWARELYAKIQADANLLSEAEAEYKKILAQGMDRASVRCGLGVVALRKAGKEKDPAQRSALLDAARAEFGTAAQLDANCPEAKIGLAHTYLLEAMLAKSPPAMDRAREEFEKVRAMLGSNLEARRNITHAGLVDYYCGMGVVNSTGDVYSPEVADYFGACRVYARNWALPLSNFMLMEAQRYAKVAGQLKDLSSEKMKLQAQLADYRRLWTSNPSNYGMLKEPWLQLNLAVAYAYAKAGMMVDYRNAMSRILGDKEVADYLEPYVVEAHILTEQLMNADKPDRIQYWAGQCNAAYDRILKSTPLQAEEHKDMRLVILNNAAVAQVALGRGAHGGFWEKRAEASLKEALKVAPNSYVINRNLAVVAAMAKQKQEVENYLKKAGEVAEAVGMQEDFQEVEKALAPK